MSNANTAGKPRKVAARLLILALLSAFGLPALPGQGADRPKAAIRDLAWMCGTWRCPRPGGEFEESWLSPEGDILVGVGRSLAGGKTRFVEYLSVEPDGESLTMWILLGTASRGPKTAKPFRLVGLADREAVFENPENEFPSRVIYRRTGEKSLVARLEGRRSGVAASDDFSFTLRAAE